MRLGATTIWERWNSVLDDEEAMAAIREELGLLAFFLDRGVEEVDHGHAHEPAHPVEEPDHPGVLRALDHLKLAYWGTRP